MSTRTLHGVAITARRPAPPSSDETLELALRLRRGTITTVERDRLYDGVEALIEALEQAQEDALVEQALATHAARELEARRVAAGFDRLSITITGRSHAEVAAGLTAEVIAERARLVERIAPAATSFDFSDCIDVEVAS